MSSLFGSLSVALQALLTQQGALQTTAQNIANINTPGYSRQRAVLREEPAAMEGTLALGQGVSLAKVESIRDRILELRLHQETQQDGELDAFLGAMRQVEALFQDAQGGGMEEALSNFFNRLQQLSTDPSSLPIRQGVLQAAGNLAQVFRRTATQITALQRNLDREMAQSVGQINELTQQIADLNVQVSGREGAGQDPGVLEDQRTQLIRRLAGLVDLSVIDAGGGNITITTQQGTALVVGNVSIALEARSDAATGFIRVFSQGTDITATLRAGRLGGALKVRDQELPAVLNDLDQLAAGLAGAVNAQHRAGFDRTGAPGGDFFVPPPSGAGAAASLAVALTDPVRLAASSDGAPGSNGNVAALARLRDQSIIGGRRPVDFYADLVARLGNDIANAAAEQEAENLVLRQLENQRTAISGVSLDEEAAHLIRFQRAFEAAARVASVVNDLTATAVNLGRA